MLFDNCKLFELRSKKVLKYILGINSNLYKQKVIIKNIRPYIDKSTEKPRLIEAPNYDLKKIQSRIKKHLHAIIVPDNIFSGIKGRSYIDNARFHVKNRFLYKTDLTGFFPSISRDRVYSFFLNELSCSPDVSEVLTNLTTIDLEKAEIKHRQEIYSFLKNKNISTKNHLISGAPTSQILSYLVNHQMFDELLLLSDKYNITMTVYVDDITFSSLYPISHNFRLCVCNIIKKYGHQISYKKVKLYRPNSPKLVTGVIITKDSQLTVKNSLRRKTIIKLKELKEDPNSYTLRQELKGLVTAVQQTNKNEYSSIYQYAYKQNR